MRLVTETAEKELRMGVKRCKNGTFKENITVGTFLFLVAFLPRAFGLNVFITIDEYLWIERSGRFLGALLRANWAATFHVGHPGVTTRWTGVLGILVTYLSRLQMASGQLLIDGQPLRGFDLLTELTTHLPEVLAAVRYPTAILTSMGVMGLYFLIRPLFGQRAALLSAVIIAWEPFYLALSRVIHHDALSTTFMALSLLSFMVYLRGHRPFFYLALSGLTAGLAFLSKSPSLFLVPFTGLLSLGAYWCRAGFHTCQGKGPVLPVPSPALSPAEGAVEGSTAEGSLWPLDWRRATELGRNWVLWGFIATLVCVLLWPAMWVHPLGTIQGVIHKATHYAVAPHENFFLGQGVGDPGPLFYPIALFFHLTPLTFVGLGSLLLLGLSSKAYRNWWRFSSTQDRGKKDGTKDRWRVMQISSLWAFILLYVLFMTTGAKKLDRYLLPIFPVMDILAALGLLELGEVIWKWGRERFGVAASILRGRRSSVLGLGLVLLLQGGFALPHYPYYLTYYNPLLGGGWLAPRIVWVGWGEGLEQAARYLNTKGSGVRVTSWYREKCFNPFFLGQSFPWSKASVFWNELDYVVFYINQVQRQFPDTQFVQCFRSMEPEHTVRIKGIDYAWIYKVPKPLPDCFMPAQYVKQTQFGDQILLLGYDIVANQEPFDGKLRINLYWQALREMGEDYTIYLKLINDAYRIWGQQDSRPYWDGLPTNSWKKGQVVGDKREIDILPGTPSGMYRVEIILYDLHSGQTLEPKGGEKPLLGPVEIPRWESLSVEALDIEHPIRANLGKVSLLGYNIESGFRPGDNIHLTLFWQCLGQMEQSYTVFTHLIDAGDNIVAQKDNPPVDGFYPTTKWEVGEIARDQYDLLISPDAPVGGYKIEVGMYLAETGERLAVNGDDAVQLNEVTIAW